MSSIPKSADFDRYMHRLVNEPQKAADDVGRWGEDSDVTVDGLEDHLVRYWERLSSVWDELATADPVGRWLNSREASRAWSALNGRRRAKSGPPRTFREIAIRQIASANGIYGIKNVEDFARSLTTKELLASKRRVASVVGRFYDERVPILRWQVAHYFREYLQETDVDSYGRGRKEIDCVIAQVRAAIELLADREVMAGIGMRPSLWTERTERNLRRREEALSDYKRAPIGRLDGTAKERALAFNLWRVFLQGTKKSKPGAVFNFLLLDGVKNPPASEKDVEGWIRIWQKNGSNHYPRVVARPARNY